MHPLDISSALGKTKFCYNFAIQSNLVKKNQSQKFAIDCALNSKPLKQQKVNWGGEVVGETLSIKNSKNKIAHTHIVKEVDAFLQIMKKF